MTKPSYTVHTPPEYQKLKAGQEDQVKQHEELTAYTEWLLNAIGVSDRTPGDLVDEYLQEAR